MNPRRRTPVPPASAGLLTLGLALGLASALAADSQAGPTAQEREVAVLETTLGTLVIDFVDEGAPQTVANFKRLVSAGFYDGTRFYRVVAGHVIQAGDGGENDEPTVPGEFGALPHEPGVVGLARAEDPDSGSTEIYICHAARPHLDGRYATFGRLVEGMEVLEAIAGVEVEERWVGDEGQVAFHEPLEPVVIQRARLERRPVAASDAP